MGAIQRYILRSSAAMFLVSLLGITGVVWLSRAMNDFDLITTKGQSFWTFFGITLLSLPSFALILAPLALFGAVIFVLRRLNTDSELAAMNAAGMRPRSVLWPFLVLTIAVSLVVAALSLSAIPASLRVIREMLTEIRADIVVNVLREGEFTSLDEGVTLHIRQRGAGAALMGILIEDRRNKAENIVYTAERGQVVKTNEGTFLVLENGAMQRKATGATDTNVVLFKRYAFDLSPLADDHEISYRPRERYLAELWNPTETSHAKLGRIRAQLHERLTNPIWPLAVTCIAFAALARPRTTRQSGILGIVVAVILVFALRLAGVGLVNLARTREWAVPALYALPLFSAVIALAFALGFHHRLRRVSDALRRRLTPA
jgi:lipopolysaccharide export system permease protein